MTIGRCVLNCLYNLDRAAASLFGAHPQATISSELARHKGNDAADAVSSILNALDKGHTLAAQVHTQQLTKALKTDKSH